MGIFEDFSTYDLVWIVVFSEDLNTFQIKANCTFIVSANNDFI